MDINRIIKNFIFKQVYISNLTFPIPSPNLPLSLKLSLWLKQAGSDLYLAGSWPTSSIFIFVQYKEIFVLYCEKPLIFLRSAKLIPAACFMLSQTTYSCNFLQTWRLILQWRTKTRCCCTLPSHKLLPPGVVPVLLCALTFKPGMFSSTMHKTK